MQQVASFVNKVYVATRLYLEKNTHHDIEGFQLRRQWQDMQRERESERKLIGKLVTQLRKMVASGREASGIDKVLAYMAEQIELIKAAQ